MANLEKLARGSVGLAEANRAVATLARDGTLSQIVAQFRWRRQKVVNGFCGKLC
ncbi:hypothetical protein [Pseudoduganella sp. OTU4001]|uniref:hypothetical protein n=1 Tax=Pseudoduganella sp. OTU4001 TaxID=3043854 RepID=UPI00313E048B